MLQERERSGKLVIENTYDCTLRWYRGGGGFGQVVGRLQTTATSRDLQRKCGESRQRLRVAANFTSRLQRIVSGSSNEKCANRFVSNASQLRWPTNRPTDQPTNRVKISHNTCASVALVRCFTIDFSRIWVTLLWSARRFFYLNQRYCAKILIPFHSRSNLPKTHQFRA